jgi:hypothetical protein
VNFREEKIMGFPIDTNLEQTINDLELKKPKFESLRCNFCGKFHLEVKKMIAGPDVMICDECIGLCVDMIREQYPDFCKVI